MGIYQRITSDGPDKIAVHRLYSSMVEYLRGELTGQQVIDALNLSSEETTELQAIIDAVDAESTIVGKVVYLEAVHSVFMLSESGDYTEAKAKSSLGF